MIYSLKDIIVIITIITTCEFFALVFFPEVWVTLSPQIFRGSPRSVVTTSDYLGGGWRASKWQHVKGGILFFTLGPVIVQTCEKTHVLKKKTKKI